MTTLVLAKSFIVPAMILAMIAAVVALAIHHRWRRLWLGSVAAAVLGTCLWFAITLPLSLMDGWSGFTQEWPYMLNALLICAAINFPIALGVGLLVRHHRATQHIETTGGAT